ncbi:MAG: PadR family transcriptional regulator [Lachnospiraceae bacterium]
MEEKLVTCEVVIQGEKLEKKLYSITEAGKQQLQEWLMKDEPLEATPKDVFRLRMYFSRFHDTGTVKNPSHKSASETYPKEQYLSDIMLDHYHNTAPAIGTREFGDFMVLEGAIMREKSYIDWINDCLRRCSTSSAE